MLEQEEKWLPVVGFEDYYEVSDQGRVRGLPRTYPRSNGHIGRRRLRFLALSRFLPGKNYRRVSLCVEGGKINRQVHTLVLEAFCGLRPPGHETRHLNGVEDDNRLVNLAWGTRQENVTDVERHGTRRRGSQTRKSKLREADIPLIRAAFADGKTVQEIAPSFGVTYQTIIAVTQGRTWRHV